MEFIQGEVQWQHVARSRAVRRIVERSIARWVEAQRSESDNELSTPRYSALFAKQGDGHLVQCEIQIIDGGKSWFGSRIGQGIQEAVAECLAHMSSFKLVPLSVVPA